MKRFALNAAAIISLLVGGFLLATWWRGVGVSFAFAPTPAGQTWYYINFYHGEAGAEACTFSSNLVPYQAALTGFHTDMDYVERVVESCEEDVGRTAITDKEIFSGWIRTWYVIPLIWILPFMAMVSWLRRRKSPTGICAHCGYDLRATPGRCPECGMVPGTGEKSLQSPVAGTIPPS